MILVRDKRFGPVTGLMLLVLLPFTVMGQQKIQNRKIFAEAESHYLFFEYELANPLYLLLDKPDNFNIQYKIGTSYLNIPGEKERAIPFLESAVTQAHYGAKTDRFSEKKAPLDAWFALGKAYMINNNLDKALETLNNFKKLALETEKKGGMQNISYVDQQIEAIKNAKLSQENPYRISKSLLGKQFSQGSMNENPAVSYDGNTLVYTERRGIVNAIMFSRRINGVWQDPVEINSQLKCGDDCSSCSLNYDGTLLFLYKTDNFDGNIYSSEFINNTWTPVTKLNRNINTKFYESHAAISPDGKKLYFTSNRDGGFGGLDIYVSEKDSRGDWGPAVNLGNQVNTLYNEDTPFITINDSLLYFSSEGHSGTGGYDIFRSRRSGNEWEKPENLGFPINSTDDDRFFQPFNNDQNGFYSIATGYKKKEIFYLTLTNEALNKIYEISGNYSLKDTIMEFGEDNAIYLTDRMTGDTLDTVLPDRLTGDYNFITAPGKFRIIYTGPKGYYSQYADTAVLTGNPAETIRMQDIVLDKNPPPTEKIDLSKIPAVKEIDPGILVTDLKISDISENDAQDTTILYYTVQVMALFNPVDISYFRHVSDIKVFYNESDYFYRYTTGIFTDKNDAYAHRDYLFRMGYPDDLFVKKVTRISGEKPVESRSYYTIQLKATRTPLDMNSTFRGLKDVREAKEIDGMFHYLYGRYSTPEEAKTVLQRSLFREFSDAFVREISVLVNE